MGARRTGGGRRLEGVRRDRPGGLRDRRPGDDRPVAPAPAAEGGRTLPPRAAGGAASAREFAARVYAAVRGIPPGRVATYGDIAEAAGGPRAWRAVGTLMRTCPDPGIPCHRVVAAGGRLGGYGGREDVKHYLLAAEGVRVVNGRIRGFAGIRWAVRR